MRLADADRAEAARHVEAARVARRALEENGERLAAELERLEKEPPDFKRFLDMPLKDGTTTRAFYNRVMAPVRAKQARSAALLDEVRQEAKHSGAYDLEALSEPRNPLSRAHRRLIGRGTSAVHAGQVSEMATRRDSVHLAIWTGIMGHLDQAQRAEQRWD